MEEAAEKVRKYNAWREEHGYQNIGFASVEEEFNTVGLYKLNTVDPQNSFHAPGFFP